MLASPLFISFCIPVFYFFILFWSFNLHTFSSSMSPTYPSTLPPFPPLPLQPIFYLCLNLLFMTCYTSFLSISPLSSSGRFWVTHKSWGSFSCVPSPFSPNISLTSGCLGFCLESRVSSSSLPLLPSSSDMSPSSCGSWGPSQSKV